ncbi:phytoene/squalene synthase family protein [Bacteroidota bacterium]
MNILIYNKTSYKLSKVITNSYSTSFSLGIKAFAKVYRAPIYAVYAFVRLSDEIVDTFHDFDKKSLLMKFREDTMDAINSGISTNPILNAFQNVVNTYNIEKESINAFLNSMEMDLNNSSYERDKYDTYIYGSAEVVGLMCLKVFCNGDNNKYLELHEPARMLGAAFQKVNFLRDISSDFKERGRIYFPNVHNHLQMNNSNKKKLEEEVQKEFKEALKGIVMLPKGVKLGVYSAYLYYLVLFKKIQRLDINELLKRRIRISNIKKLGLLLKSIVKVRIFKVT